MEIKIKQLLRLPELDGVVVNSNSDEMLEIAKSAGAEVVKRDEYFASSIVPINEVYEDIAKHFDADIIVYANVTNPLIKDKTISQAIRKYQELFDDFDSLNTAHRIKEFMWLYGNAINYNHAQMPKSQNLPDIFALNFAVNISKRDDIIKNKSIVGMMPYIYPIDETEATDIDNEIDFEFAEFMYKKLNS